MCANRCVPALSKERLSLFLSNYIPNTSPSIQGPRDMNTINNSDRNCMSVNAARPSSYTIS
jgi:hypothetical protein